MGMHALRGLMAAVLVTVVAVSCSPSRTTDDGSLAEVSNNGAESGSMFEALVDENGQPIGEIILISPHSVLLEDKLKPSLGFQRFHELTITNPSEGVSRVQAQSMSAAMTRGVLNRLAELYAFEEIHIVRSGRFTTGSWDLDCTISIPFTWSDKSASHPNEDDPGIMGGVVIDTRGGEHSSQDGDAWHCAWAILSQLDGIGGDAGFWLDSLVAKRGKQETKYIVQLRLADRRNAEVEEIMLKSRFAGSTVEMHQGNDGKGSVALTVGGTVSPIGERTMLSSKVALKGSLVLPETPWSPAGASAATPMPRDNDREHREWKSRQGK